MSRQADGRVDSRGTVLVASASNLFIEILGHMVADCGFAADSPERAETAAQSMMRTQPTLVICDCTGPDASISRLIVEVSARGRPLLMACLRGQEHDIARDVVLPKRVEWIAFPVDQEAFRATIDRLLTPATTPVHRLTLAGTSVMVEAAIATRTLDEAESDNTCVTENGGTPKRTVRRSIIRLLP